MKCKESNTMTLISTRTISHLVAWGHKENHAFQQHAQVQQLVTLRGARFHLEEGESEGAV